MAFIPRPTLPKGCTFAGIVRPRPGNALRVIALTSRYAGFWTHFTDRTIYCPGGAQCACEGLTAKSTNRRWKGYLPALSFMTGRPCCLELTASMASWIDAWHDRGIELRGKLLTATRQGTVPNAPIHIGYEDCDRRGALLPDWFDPTWTVLAVLGVPYQRIAEMHAREESHLMMKDSDLRADVG
jgi:hypothetical protein